MTVMSSLLPNARLLVLAALSLCGASPLLALPAFPGAEGYGGNATGGRGGDVYIVTNLNASGAGSFAEGIATVPSAGRTIVFAVSGHIHINGLRLTASKVTIAGQTAPGDGVGLKDGTFRISGDEVVVRHMRFRHRASGGGGDCINLDSGSINSVLDSVSMAFSTDENFSSFNSPPENVTMQWSLNAWGLESHSCGGLWDQNHATAHHTLWAHNHTRNPKARPAGLLEWINNVTFDWDIGFIMGDSETPASWKANVLNSYFLAPAGNIRTKALEKANLDRNGVPNFSIHLSNNRHDSNGDGILNGTDKGYGIASGSYTTLATPAANTGSIPVTMDDPTVAFKKVVSKAGPLRLDVAFPGTLRDEVDTKLLNNLVTQTRNHISNESQLGLTNGGIGTLNSTAAPVDTDKDGMPDYYEDALLWSKTAQDHNTALASSGGFLTGTTFMPTVTAAGYTRLEEYLHFLAIPHGTVAKNIAGSPTSIAVNMAKFTSGFSASPVFTFSNALNGTVSIAGSVATFTPTVNFTGRARFDFTVTDSAGHAWTQTCALVVTNNALPRDLLWKGSAAAWDIATLDWLRPSNGSTVAFSSGDRVAFDQSGLTQPVVTVTGSLSPTTVEVNAAGNYTFGGASGDIASTGTLTKRGTGTLTLTHAENYAGGVALDEGALILGAGGGLGGGTVTMLDGTVFTNGYATGNTLGVGNAFDVPAGNSATLNTGNRLSLSGAFTGAGTLALNVQTTVTRADFKGPMAAFAGSLNFTGGGGARLFFNGESFNGFDAASVDIGGTVSLQPQTNSGGNTLNIGALSGASAAANLAGGTAGTVAYVIGGKNTASSYAGSITGNATLTKAGTATLTLTGTNTYTGATTVSAGSFAVNGTLSSATTVASGAVLRGAGTFTGSVTTQSGAQISPGAGSGQIGTLTAAAGLTATSNTFSMQLSSSPAGVNDKIAITGGSGLVSGTNVFAISLADGFLGAGNYRLIECAAGIPLSIGSGMAMSYTLNAPTDGRQTYGLNRTASGTAGGYIQLTVTGNPATLTWTGAATGIWDTTTTGNWTGAAPNNFFSFDSVLFDDTAATRTVTLSGSVDPRDITVNTALGYTFATETAGFSAWGRLVKNGAGTLTLTGSTPGTTGQNDFTGGVILNAGTIAFANDNASITGGPVTLNAGTFTMFSDNTSYSDNGNDFIVPAGATARINADGRVDMTGSLTGGGTLNFYIPFIRTTLFGDWSAFTGTINVLTDGDGGEFRVGTSYGPAGYAGAAIALTAGVSFRYEGTLATGAGTTLEVGALSGPFGSNIRGGATGGRALTYRIGGRNTDALFAGDIAEQNTGTATNYIKTGTGKWTLSGPCAWNGGTTVEQGTLHIYDLTCGGATTVAPGATLILWGHLGTETLNVAAGATLTVEDDSEILGDLNNSGTATFHTGHLILTGSVVNNGTMRFTGGLTLAASGEFVNNGILDLLTASAGLPADFVNNGVVIDSSSLRMIGAVKTGNTVTLSVQTYAGHIYQLQRADSLTAPVWTDISGQAFTGNGTPHNFTDTAATGTQRYYRVSVTP